jgi:GNAT superfamily N-acetyltransferase
MLIRAAELVDAAAIARVHVDSWRTTYRGIVPDDALSALSYEQREQTWRRAISDSDNVRCVYVAEADGRHLIGFASGGPERSGDQIYVGELYAIYLLAERQRKGAGRRLALAVASHLLRGNLTSMLVWVLAENPARSFYATLGGQQVYEKTETIGGARLVEVAYGWRDLRALVDSHIKTSPVCDA